MVRVRMRKKVLTEDHGWLLPGREVDLIPGRAHKYVEVGIADLCISHGAETAQPREERESACERPSAEARLEQGGQP